jgi:NitT/TauT family transport system substrate-binding protein
VIAVFATFQTSPQAIMVHASRGLTSIAEVFRSGTLAVEPGMAYAAYLKQKFSWEGVQVVPYDGGVARFLTDPNFGQQCYVTSEPIAAKKQGGDPQVFLIADAGYNPYTTVVVARRELVEQKPEWERVRRRDARRATSATRGPPTKFKAQPVDGRTRWRRLSSGETLIATGIPSRSARFDVRVELAILAQPARDLS